MKRIFLIVLDSFGIGEMEDAAAYGDSGTNTIGSVSQSGWFEIPNLKKLGIFNIEGVDCHKLEKLGIEEGDTVKMYGWQFEYFR